MRIATKDKLATFIPIVLLLISVILFYIITIKPTRQRINKLQQKLENKRLELTKIKESGFNSQNIIAKKRDLDRQLNSVNSIVPKQMSLTLFLSQIEELVAENNIDLEKFAPKEGSSEEEYNKLSIKLIFSGNYQDIIAFIKELEVMNRLVNINNLLITDREDGTLKITSVLEIYSIDQGDR